MDGGGAGPVEQLIEFLREQGVLEDEIQAAAAQGFVPLQLLASERIIIGGEQRYTAADVATMAAVEQDLADRFWRALGFPDVAEDQRVFTEADARMLAAAGAMIAQGVSHPEDALQVTRVMGLSLARVAEAQIGTLRDTVEASMRQASASEEQIAVNLTRMATQLLPTLESFLVYTWRRHLADAARRHTVAALESGGEARISLTVGFVDMAGFTALSQQLEDRELGRIVERFEGLAYDTVAACGGRVVKWIGDEVMFVVEEATAAAEIGLRLAEAHAAAEDLPDVSVGLSAGEVLPREGDYLGLTVNVAARIVSIARPATVVVSESVRDLLAGSGTEDYVWRPLRPRTLKGLGRVPMWKLARGIPASGAADEDEQPPARIARTREDVHDVLEEAKDLVDRVGPPLEKIEETIERVKERRRSARSRRRETP